MCGMPTDCQHSKLRTPHHPAPAHLPQVVVCESHDTPGGAAHAWTVPAPGGGGGVYHFEAGPSLYSDMGGRGRGANPLAHVLQALGEPLDLLQYKNWNVLVPGVYCRAVLPLLHPGRALAVLLAFCLHAVLRGGEQTARYECHMHATAACRPLPLRQRASF